MNHVQYAKVDTGASSHFVKSEHQDLLSNLANSCEEPIAALPNNKKIQATARGTLPFDGFS